MLLFILDDNYVGILDKIKLKITTKLGVLMQGESEKETLNLAYQNNGDFSQSIHSIKGEDMEYSLERISDRYLIYKTNNKGFEVEIGDENSFEEAKDKYIEIISNLKKLNSLLEK